MSFSLKGGTAPLKQGTGTLLVGLVSEFGSAAAAAGHREQEEKRLMMVPGQGGGTKCMPAILWAESNVTAIPSARLLKSALTTTVVNPF